MKKINKKQNIKLPKFDDGGNTDPYRFGNYSQQNLSPMGDNTQSSSGGMGSSGWGQVGMMGAQMGMSMMANRAQQGQGQQGMYGQNPQQSQYSKETQQYNQMNQATDQGISKIPGFGQFYGLAKTGEGVGKSMINKDENGNPINNNNQIAANFMNSTHEQVLNDVAHKRYGYALADSMVNKGVGSMAVGVIGTHNPIGKAINKWATSNNNPNEDGSEPTPEVDGVFGKANKQYKQSNLGMNFHMRDGGIMKPFYNSQHQPLSGFYLNGGMHNFYAEGGEANAQIEKQENFITPQGEFGQANGPSHEQGGIDINIPQGTIIFSDKLKAPGTKKTFAQLNKKNDTTKEDELLEDKNSTSESKKSAKLMLEIKKANSSKLFQEQESLKQNRLNSYIKRLGGVQKFPGGGIVQPQTRDQWSVQMKNNGYTQLDNNRYYDPSNYSYYDYTSNQSPKPYIDPNHQAVQFGPNMNFNPNTNQYTNPQGQEIRQSNFKFGIGGAFGGNFNNSINSANSMTDTNYPDNAYYKSGDWEKDFNQIQVPYNSPQDTTSSNSTDPYRFGNYDQKNLNLINNSKATSKQLDPRWKDAAYLGVGTIAQSAGQLAYLREQGKRYDTQKFHQYNPTTLNDATAIAEARRQSNAVNASLAGGAGGSANNYMSNRIQAGQSNADELAKIRMEYENANAGIRNQGSQFNIGNQYRTDDINAANKGAALSNYYNSIGSVGTNVASGMRDYRADKYDQQRMNMLPMMYSNPQFQQYYRQYSNGR